MKHFVRWGDCVALVGEGELVTGRVVYGYVVRVGRYSKAWYQVRVGCG